MVVVIHKFLQGCHRELRHVNVMVRHNTHLGLYEASSPHIVVLGLLLWSTWNPHLDHLPCAHFVSLGPLLHCGGVQVLGFVSCQDRCLGVTLCRVLWFVVEGGMHWTS